MQLGFSWTAATTGTRADIKGATKQMERGPCGEKTGFRDLVGKLDVLNVECDRCGRRGRYRLDRLIERYGIDAELFDWSDDITANCPRKQANNLNDICGASCPDLSKVV